MSRRPAAYYDLGYHETDVQKVPRGKVTLRQAIQFISDHQQHPEEWTAERIANEYKVKRENVDNIIEHFRMFQIHLPKEEGSSKQYLIDPFDKKSSNFEKFLEDAAAKPKDKKESANP